MDVTVDAPTVEYESLEELWELCSDLLDSYVTLTRQSVDGKLSTRSKKLLWTEYDRLILGLADFDELIEEGTSLVLHSTKSHGTSYAHDLNRKIVRLLNSSNKIFFHRTSIIDVEELHDSIVRMLRRVFLTSSQSHFDTLRKKNFVSLCDWDGEEWMLCPNHKISEYKMALAMSQHERLGKGSLVYLLPEDTLVECLKLVGMIQ
jgi:hypothetical protein